MYTVIEGGEGEAVIVSTGILGDAHVVARVRSANASNDKGKYPECAIWRKSVAETNKKPIRVRFRAHIYLNMLVRFFVSCLVLSCLVLSCLVRLAGGTKTSCPYTGPQRGRHELEFFRPE